MSIRGNVGSLIESHRAATSRPDRRNFTAQARRLPSAAQFSERLPQSRSTVPNSPPAVPNFPTLFPDFSAADIILASVQTTANIPALKLKGWTGADTVAFTAVRGTFPASSTTQQWGCVNGVIITSGGSEYSSVPQVQFVGGSGFGASGTTVVSNGMVTAINMTSSGFYNLTSLFQNRVAGEVTRLKLHELHEIWSFLMSAATVLKKPLTAPSVIQIDGPIAISSSLPDETNATLTLPSVTSADSTNYFVVVTNNYGSVTSATVFLNVFLPPQNLSAQDVAAGLQVQFTGTPYYPYILQSATNLTPPISWKSILTNRADVNGNWQFTDTNLDEVQRFYRAVGR